MSGSEVIALAAVMVSGMLGVVTLAFNFWNASSERVQRLKERKEDEREWYRRTLFDRRLSALQEGKRILEEVGEELYGPDNSPESAPIGSLRTWYDNDVVYVHGEMPSHSPVGDFVYGAWRAATQDDIMPRQEEWVAAKKFLTEEANRLLEQLDDR